VRVRVCACVRVRASACVGLHFCLVDINLAKDFTGCLPRKLSHLLQLVLDKGLRMGITPVTNSHQKEKAIANQMMLWQQIGSWLLISTTLF